MSANILSGPKEDSGIPHQSMGKLLLDALNSHEENNLALIDIKSGESYTYSELINFSQNLASNLQKLNIKKNIVIGIISENSHKFCVALLAGLYLAAPIHLINPGYTEYELKHILALSKPQLLFCSKKSLNKLMKIKSDFDFIQTIVSFDDDNEEDERYTTSYKNLIKKSTTLFRVEEDIDTKTQIAMICNSSGTTGMPKGVLLTHDNFRIHLVYGRNIVFCMKPTECLQIVVPLFHTYGIHIFNAGLYFGCTLLLIDHFNPKVFLETIQKYQVEQLFLVPSLINFLVNSPLTDQHDLSSVKRVYTGAAPLLEEDSIQLKTKLLKLRSFHLLYGLTETSGLVVSTPFDESCPSGSCGKLTPGSQLKVVDVENRHNLDAYQNGELLIKGPTIMRGYIGDVGKNEEVFDSEGFLYTGDLGYYDEKGFIYVVGRIKDMICYKAFKVSPVEIENILLKHPSVQDVAVIGKPDRRTGEVAVGFIVKKGDASVLENEISEYLSKFVCREKLLHGGVRFVNVIPKNSSGKVLRHRLREMLDQEKTI